MDSKKAEVVDKARLELFVVQDQAASMVGFYSEASSFAL